MRHVKSGPWIVLGYAVVIAFAVARVTSTLGVFSATMDEPTHIACGSDWLHGLPYTAHPDNPPLARILGALPSWLARIPAPPLSDDQVTRGDAILYSSDYVRNIARARLGSVLLFAIAMAAVGWWGTRRFGPVAGLIAIALFSWLPLVRAHAGLATTDMAIVATLPLALVLLDRWLDAPTLGRGVALGAALGAGSLAKLSFLLFFPIAAAILIGVRLARRDRCGSIRTALATGVVGSLIVWAGYRFDTGTFARAHRGASYLVSELFPKKGRETAMWIASNVPLPAPLFFVGGAALKVEDRHGYEAFLLGEVRRQGWWYYFPVALFFKTPLPFLILGGVGMALIIARQRHALDVALIPPAILSSVLPSSIDLGVRYLLPLFAPLAVAAAHAVITMGKKRSWRVPMILLVAWMFLGTEHAHPDYLAWFNETAGAHPEHILVDSNLDWGQDYLRLIRTLHDRRITDIYLLPFGSVQLWNHGINARRIEPWKSAPGWYVMPETALAIDADARGGAYRWLDRYAYERIGKSLRLYHVPR